MNVRFYFAGILALAPTVALSARLSAEDQARVNLDYQTDADIEGCPSTETVEQALSAKLGYDAFVPPAEHGLALRVRRRGRGIAGSIELRGPRTGRREIVSERDDCREVVDALVVAAAIAIDPAVLVRPPSSSAPSASHAPEPPPPATSVAARPKPPPEPAPTPVAVSSTPPESEPPRYSVLLAANVLVGELPKTMPAVEAGARLRLGWGSLALSVLDTGTSDTDNAGGGHGKVSLFAFNFTPCGHFGAWSGCLLGSLGVLQAEGVDVDLPKRAERRTLLAGPLIAHDWEVLEFLHFGFFAAAVVPILRTTITVDGQDIWSTPAIAGRFGGRLAWSF